MYEGFTERPLETFGGLSTLSSNTLDVPAGESPACQDMDFIGENTFTRAGLTSVATLTGGIIGIKEYVMIDPTSRRVLALSDAGVLSKETGNYSFSTVDSNIAEATIQSSLRFRSQTLFGREYMAFSQNGTKGVAVPRQYDDTTLGRVAPDGPGGAVTVVSAGGGTIDVGAHQFRVFARTDSGYWTSLGPPVSWTPSTSGLLASVSNIPTGPSNWVARVVAMSPVGDTTNFYFVEGSSMVINDNTTTTATINLNDSTLIAGTTVASTIDPSVDLLRQITLPAQANVVTYNRRLAWTGERNTIELDGDLGFRNMGFLGGVHAATPNAPSGWTERVAGESLTTQTGAPGTVLKVTGNGAAQRGVLQNIGNASQVIPPGVTINCRMRAIKSTSATGTFHAWLVDSATASNTPTAGQNFSMNMTTLSSTEWRVIDAQMATSAGIAITPTTVLRIGSGDGTVGSYLPNNEWVIINYIELYPASQAYSPSLVRWSKIDDPEAYDGLTGIMNVAENDGQSINACFTLRNACYFVKDRSLYSTQDNGQTEPNEWDISRVSATVGCLSPNGVAVGDNWAVIAARAGLHYFDGAALKNVSNKIKTTWQRINWLYGYKIWVLVDVEEKRIMIGVPLDTSTTINYILYARYDGATPGDGKLEWCPWVSTSACAGWSERSDGTRVWLEGASSGGKVYKRDKTVYTDDSAAIAAYYQTYFLGDTTGIQLIGYITANIYGGGTVQVDLYSPDGTVITTLNSVPLTATSYTDDLELIAQTTVSRAAVRFTAVGVGANFAIQKCAVYTKPHPWASLRGTVAK